MSKTHRDLVLVGAGGYFLELYDYITSDIEKGLLTGIELKGFLDESFDSPPRSLQYLGKPSEYQIKSDDVFLICLGKPQAREAWFETLSLKGGQFFTYVHSSAIVSQTAVLGNGVIVAPFSIVNSDARVGDNVSLNVSTSVGHEAHVGRSSSLSPYSAINGRASAGEQCFLGTRSTLFPGVSIGDQTIVDSHSYVNKDVGERKIVAQRGTYECLDNRFLRKKV
ncbi:MAG: transferase [Pseudomonadota bacterium]